MNRAARVLCDSAAKYFDLGSVRIDFNVHHGCRKCRAHVARIDSRPSNDRPSGPSKTPGQLRYGQRRDPLALSAEYAIVELHFFGCLLPKTCGAFLKLTECIVRRFIDGLAACQSRAATSGDIGVADAIGV